MRSVEKIFASFQVASQAVREVEPDTDESSEADARCDRVVRRLNKLVDELVGTPARSELDLLRKLAALGSIARRRENNHLPTERLMFSSIEDARALLTGSA